MSWRVSGPYAAEQFITKETTTCDWRKERPEAAEKATATQIARSDTAAYIAFDLSRTKWQLAMSDGARGPRDVVVDSESAAAAKAEFIRDFRSALAPGP